MESVLNRILPALSTVDIKDVHEYQYCVIFTPPQTFEVYDWRRGVRFNSELIKRFYACNWESIIDDPSLFDLLKKKIIQLLEKEAYFPFGVEHIEVPSIVIKGNLPTFPFSKCVFALPVYQRNVTKLNFAYENKIGIWHFNNGLFVYTRVLGNDMAESDDSEEYSDDSEDSCHQCNDECNSL